MHNNIKCLTDHLLFYSFLYLLINIIFFSFNNINKNIKFQITSTIINVPKEHHYKLIGKQGAIRKDIELRTGARIQIPSFHNASEIVNITGSKYAVAKAVQVCIQNIF